MIAFRRIQSKLADVRLDATKRRTFAHGDCLFIFVFCDLFALPFYHEENFRSGQSPGSERKSSVYIFICCKNGTIDDIVVDQA